MPSRPSSRITPTAHYTGYVWCRNGLSPSWLATPQGRLLFAGLEPVVRLGSRATGGVTIETFLLERHRMIDRALDRAVEQGLVGQVVELAAGLSGRGLRMVARHRAADLRYLEADLPAMAARKQRLLDRGADARSRPSIVPIDVLATEGPLSLEQALGERLDPGRGTALVVEGLLTYFDRATVVGLWARWAAWLTRFPRGLYLSDVHLTDARTRAPLPRLFVGLLGLFAGTRVHLHFSSPADAVSSAMHAGFSTARVQWPRPEGAEADPDGRGAHDYVGLLEASVP